MHRFTAPLLGAFILAVLPAQAAEQRYRGVFDDSGRNVPVSLSVDPAASLGVRAGELRFDGSWKCGFALEASGARGNASSFDLQGAGPGRCAGLAGGHLLLLPGASGAQVQLLDKANQPTQRFELGVAPD